LQDEKFSDGFELILPSQWAMPFWIAFVYQGARAGGEEEAANVCFEASTLHFPRGYVDTNAGQVVNNETANSNEKKYNR